ncbi:peptidylprolyl isomerase [Vulcanococcus limneticus]|uniref:peptidylprolyl isomerase n=1 Tax=Vulcanococcus limneticus TaxID=2170428 RepID=UPI00398BCD0C
MLPQPLRRIGERLPLPAKELTRELALHDLHRAYLRRQLLNSLLALETPEGKLLPDLDTAIRDLVQRQGISGEAELERWRLAQGLTLDELQSLATFPARLEAVTERIWGEDVPGIFLQRRSEFDTVVLSLVRFSDPDLAQELYFQLLEGELGFTEMVEVHARGADQLNRGLLGPVRLKNLHPLLACAAERYTEGMLVPPLDIEGQVHLIRVESLQKAQLDDSLRRELLQDLCQRWLQEQLQILESRLLTQHGEDISP